MNTNKSFKTGVGVAITSVLLAVFAAVSFAMAPTSTIDPTSRFPGTPLIPVSVESNWTTVVSAGLGTADAATITNPETQINRDTSKIFYRAGKGTTLRVRVAYDAALTVTTPLKYKVFGRARITTPAGITVLDPWQVLASGASAISRTAAFSATTDATDGTMKYTLSDIFLDSFDSDGCTEFVIGIETALGGSGGVVTTARIEAKWL